MGPRSTRQLAGKFLMKSLLSFAPLYRFKSSFLQSFPSLVVNSTTFVVSVPIEPCYQIEGRFSLILSLRGPWRVLIKKMIDGLNYFVSCRLLYPFQHHHYYSSSSSSSSISISSALPCCCSSFSFVPSPPTF